MSKAKEPTVKITNKTRMPLPLSFTHAEVCGPIGRCICDRIGKGGTIHLAAMEKGREVHPRLLFARQFKAAEKSGAISVNRVMPKATDKDAKAEEPDKVKPSDSEDASAEEAEEVTEEVTEEEPQASEPAKKTKGKKKK